MKTAKHIKYEGKGFYCDACCKLHDGIGYLIGSRAFCVESYEKKFPKFKENK